MPAPEVRQPNGVTVGDSAEGAGHESTGEESVDRELALGGEE